MYYFSHGFSLQKSPAPQTEPGESHNLCCAKCLWSQTGYSAMKSRWMEESTFTPGPMVEESEMLFT